MSKDSVFKELKERKKLAFHCKEKAFKNFDEARACAKAARKEMKSAKVKLENLRAELDIAFQNMTYANEHDKEFWDEYHRIRDGNNSQIKVLCEEANAEHAAMKESYASAKAARNAGNKPEAYSYIIEGRDHEERRNALNIEISNLAQEVKDAKAYAIEQSKTTKTRIFHQTKAKFDIAKSEYQAARDYFEQCNAKRKRLWNEFEDAESKYICARNDLESCYTGGKF